MGAISDFVAAFRRDCKQYKTRERELEARCKDALQGVNFSWQSRVKATDSLEKKLRDRMDEYKDESENVADIKDLVGGRIILTRWGDFQRVKDIVYQKFHVRRQAQHPKDGKNTVNLHKRFRGYDGIHYYVTLQGSSSSDAPFFNSLIEIQVMSGYMWQFMDLEHDIAYKRKHGEPDDETLLCLELHKGFSNLGEIGLQIYEKTYEKFPIAKKLSTQQRDINQDLQATMRTVVAEVGFDRNDKRNASKIPISLYRKLEGWLKSLDTPILWIRQEQGIRLSSMAVNLSAHLVHGALERQLPLICSKCHTLNRSQFPAVIQTLNRQVSCYQEKEESAETKPWQEDADSLTVFENHLTRISCDLYGVFYGFQNVIAETGESGDVSRFHEILLSHSRKFRGSKILFVTQRNDQCLNEVLDIESSYLFRDVSPQLSVETLKFSPLD